MAPNPARSPHREALAHRSDRYAFCEDWFVSHLQRPREVQAEGREVTQVHIAVTVEVRLCSATDSRRIARAIQAVKERRIVGSVNGAVAVEVAKYARQHCQRRRVGSPNGEFKTGFSITTWLMAAFQWCKLQRCPLSSEHWATSAVQNRKCCAIYIDDVHKVALLSTYAGCCESLEKGFGAV